MRYVAYVRVSTDSQADTGHGLEVQVAAVKAWARTGHHRLVEVCTDAGLSGTLDVGARPGLARALAITRSKAADGLLVYRLDRLARDMVLQETLLSELHRGGKELHSCSPTEDAVLADDASDPTRALVRRVLGALAAYERDMIRLRLEAGRLRKAMAGGYIHGAPAYGWTPVRGDLVKVPDEQRAIRLMCRLHAEGKSYRAIAAHLEREGIPSRASHKRWRPNTILAIVGRENARKVAVTRPPATPAELVGASA